MSFVPVPFSALLERLTREAPEGRLFGDVPAGWWTPGAHDLSATLFGQRCGNPFGPAAGPDASLAHELVRSWIAGGRVLGLGPAGGLRPGESVREFAKAAALIAILDREDGFGLLPRRKGREAILEANVGGDLAGLRAASTSAYLRRLVDPAPLYDELRSELTGPLARFREHVPEGPLARTVVLSALPVSSPRETEGIARYLMEEFGFSVVLELDATPREGAALELVAGLTAAARAAGSGFGVRLARTHHVLALELLVKLGRGLGAGLPPVSFSAVLTPAKAAEAVACGLLPVTSCTDLLRTLRALEKAMDERGAATLAGFVLAGGPGAAAAEEALRALPGGAWERHGAEAVGVPPDTRAALLRIAAVEAGADPEALLAGTVRDAGLRFAADLLAKASGAPARESSPEPLEVAS